MSETTSRIVEAAFKSPQISDWERHRPLITKLYKEEGKPLRVVMRVLSEQYGFYATERMFKNRVKQWNLPKYHKSEDIDDLLRHFTKDELQSTVETGRDSRITLRGRILSRPSLQRYLRRRRPSETSRGCSTSSSTRPQSDEVSFASRTTLPHAGNARPDKCDEPALLEACSPSPSQSLISHRSQMNPRPECQSFRESGSPDIASAITSHSSCALPTVYRPFCDEGASDARRKRRKTAATNLSSSFEAKQLACPFYKHDSQRYNPRNEDMDSAMRYRTCAGPGWISISRLRQHLFRAHFAPKHCELCKSVLQSRNDLENHNRTCSGGVITDEISASDTITDEQQYKLKQKQLPGLTKEYSWRRIYRILFPSDLIVPSPYYEGDISSVHLDSLIQHLCATLPQKILGAWQGGQEPHGVSTSIDKSGATARNSADEIRLCSPAPIEQPIEEPNSDEFPVSHSVQKLKTIISNSVTETYTEWLGNRKEQDDDEDSGEEESEDDNEQGQSTSTLTNPQDQSLASMTRMEDQWLRYSETGFDPTWTNPTIDTTTPSGLQLPPTSDGSWTYLPYPDTSSYIGAGMDSALDSNSDGTSFLPSNYLYSSWLPGPEFMFSSMQPDVALSNSIDPSTSSTLYEYSWPPSYPEIDWRRWEQATIQTEIATTLPEPNQGP